MENKGKKIIKKMMSYIELLAVLLLSILYVVQGYFLFARTNKSLDEIIGSIVEGFCVGLTIYICFRTLGLKNGREDEKFLASIEYYSKKKEETIEFRHKTRPFCVMKYTQDLEDARREFLEEYGLNYLLWKKGVYTKEAIEKMQLTKEQVTALEKVSKVKVNIINASELYSDISFKGMRRDKYGNFGKSDKDFKRSGILTDAIFMLVTTTVFGFYTIVPIVDKDVSTMLWNLLQLSIWLAFGMLKYRSCYMFIVNEYRQTHIIQKAEILNEFITIMKTNPSILDEYDYEKKYLEELSKEREEVNNGIGQQQEI